MKTIFLETNFLFAFSFLMQRNWHKVILLFRPVTFKVVSCDPPLKARTGPFPLKGRGTIMGILTSLQQLWHHGSPAGLGLNSGVALALDGIWEVRSPQSGPPQCSKIAPICNGYTSGFRTKTHKSALHLQVGQSIRAIFCHFILGYIRTLHTNLIAWRILLCKANIC